MKLACNTPQFLTCKKRVTLTKQIPGCSHRQNNASSNDDFGHKVTHFYLIITIIIIIFPHRNNHLEGVLKSLNPSKVVQLSVMHLKVLENHPFFNTCKGNTQ